MADQVKGLTERGIRFTVYDRAIWREKGHGTRAIYIARKGRTDEELLALRGEARAEQKRLNEEDEELNGLHAPPPPAREIPAAAGVPATPEINARNMPHIGAVDLALDPLTGNTIALLAASKSGKSTMLMHLYEKYWAGPKWISSLFTVSGQAPVYQGHPGLIKICGFPYEGERLIKLEKLINTKGAKPNKYKFWNALDDIIEAKHSRLLNSLLLTYRNSNMSTCLSLQYPQLMSKQTRANINFVFLGRFHSEELCGDVVQMFLRSWLANHGVRGLDAQVAWYKKVTENHGMVLIDNLKGEISLVRLAR